MSETRVPGSSVIVRLLPAVMVICAAAMTVMVGLDRVNRYRERVRAERARTPERIANWREMADSRKRIGQPSATVTIVEFGDLECPACRYYQENVIEPLLRRHAGEVTFAYRHWPLPIHRFARGAAIAVECAAEQHRFAEYFAAILRKQDSIGQFDYGRLALDIGVPDTSTFRSCMVSGRAHQQVETDAALARSLDARVTPTYIINGVLYRSPPEPQEFDRIVDRLVRERGRH